MTARRGKSDTGTKRLFRNPSGQDEMFEKSYEEEIERQAKQEVDCFGKKFENDAARRAYFLDRLGEKLRDPKFRETEGFPIGSDEDILRLSDPPYYTACPNPFLQEFIRYCGKPFDPLDRYDRRPLAVDVSEGKTDPVYAAHSYHTKVPHKAIMRAILHYTEPGDVILDGFAGTGMTGVAAQLCGSPEEEFKKVVDEEWRINGGGPPKWGARQAVLGDLSPAATFISANYNVPFDVGAFSQEAQRILDEVRAEISWMYETVHTDGKRKGFINFTVWSEVFSCGNCSRDIVFSDEALDKKTDHVREEFPCPHCGTVLTKTRMGKLYETYTDPATGQPTRRLRRTPVLINYSVGKMKYEKKPTKQDMAILQDIEKLPLPLSVPTLEIPYMHMTHERARMDLYGVTHVHHFYLPRAAQAMGRLWEKALAVKEARNRNMILFFVEQAIWGLSVLSRYAPTHYSQVNRYLSGVITLRHNTQNALPGTSWTAS